MSARILLSMFLVLLPAAAMAAPRTVWQGVYTPAQASRGEGAYAAECSRCHKDDLTGYRSLLVGERFLNDWREDSLESFFSIVRKTMPRNAPASLSDTEYVDIVAYVLKVNAFPAGQSELTAAALKDIRVEGKQGPETVPDFALVEVTGCLVPVPDGGWILTGSTEPVRTRNPGESPADELKPLQRRPPGKNTFRLLDATVVRPDLPKDHRVEAKGFLIRKPGGDNINLTSLQSLGGACGATSP